MEKIIYNPFEDPYNSKVNEEGKENTLSDFGDFVDLPKHTENKKKNLEDIQNKEEKQESKIESNLEVAANKINSIFEIENGRRTIKRGRVKLVEFLETRDDKRLYIKSLLKWPPIIFEGSNDPVPSLHHINKIYDSDIVEQKKINMPGLMGLYLDGVLSGVFGITLSQKNNIVIAKITSRINYNNQDDSYRFNVLMLLKNLVKIAENLNLLTYGFAHIDSYDTRNVYLYLNCYVIKFDNIKIYNKNTPYLLSYFSIKSLFFYFNLDENIFQEEEKYFFMESFLQENKESKIQLKNLFD